ncbi:MAG: hypothetical protein ACRD5L_02835 [Bryobacteraceae bacterium]
MSKSCRTTGCKITVPPELEGEESCLLHFTLRLEQMAGDLRRETVTGHATHERQLEIIRFVANQGEMLARVSTSGLHMPDELKARVLSTFLTLMNLRESLDRAALRMPAGRTLLKKS